MVFTVLNNRRTFLQDRTRWDQNCVINNLIESRNLSNVQTIGYDRAVFAMDLDSTRNFLLVGLHDGSVELQKVTDTQTGLLEIYGLIMGPQYCLKRIQWHPGQEKLYSMLDDKNLYIYDPIAMDCIGKYLTNDIEPSWSEWNPNDNNVVAVCGTESKTHLIDLRSDSAIGTINLSKARSTSSSHEASRSLWSRLDTNCLIVGDNEGYLHVYDTRYVKRPQILVGEEGRGRISYMSFTTDQNTIITSQGIKHHLVQWTYDKCTLKACRDKFKKRLIDNSSIDPEVASTSIDKQQSAQSKNSSNTSSTPREARYKGYVSRRNKPRRRMRIVPCDKYTRCQFYVTDRHLYCPAPATKSEKLYIYDLTSGYRMKTIKAHYPGRAIYCVTGLLPESLSLYVGGVGGLRVWSLDEDQNEDQDEDQEMR